MAESSLTLAWVDLKQAVAKFLDYGITIANWNAAQIVEIEAIVQTGVRRVYYPPAIGGFAAHEWSFLRPFKTIDTVVDQYNYDLPDDFGRLHGKIYYDLDENRDAMSLVPVSSILDMRSHSDETGYPDYFAIRYKASDGSTGQRHELIFYPTPDAVYTFHYGYEAYSGALADAYPYPLGGMQMSELYKESCLAAAEVEVLDETGVHAQMYQTLLVDAVARDRKRRGKVFGNMGHKEGYDEEFFRRGYTGSAYAFTYNGTPY